MDGSIPDVTRGDGPVDLAPDRAIATGVVEVPRGHGDLLDRFASTFHLAA